MTSSLLGQAGFAASSIGLKSRSAVAGVGGTSGLPAESLAHSSAMTLGAATTITIAPANAARQCVLIDGSPDQRCRCPGQLRGIDPPGRGVEGEYWLRA